MNQQQLIRTMVSGGPRPVAPFHHVVSAGDFHFITGQMPTDPSDPSRCVDGGIEAQTRRVMDNLALVLQGVQCDWSRVVMARVYLTDFERDFAAMNRVYASYFPEGQLPARTCIGVSALAVQALVEIDLVALR